MNFLGIFGWFRNFYRKTQLKLMREKMEEEVRKERRKCNSLKKANQRMYTDTCPKYVRKPMVQHQRR